MGTGLRRTYRKAKNLVWQFEMMGRETSDDSSWHELRKSTKALGYQLRILKPVWPKIMNASVDEIFAATLACLAARFSFRDFPVFLDIVCRGDLSDIAGPLIMGAWVVPIP